MAKPVPDHITEEGARRNARRLEAFWHGLGFPDVKARIEQGKYLDGMSSHGHGMGFWIVRSNLVNGLPAGATWADVKRIRAAQVRERASGDWW